MSLIVVVARQVVLDYDRIREAFRCLIIAELELTQFDVCVNSDVSD